MSRTRGCLLIVGALSLPGVLLRVLLRVVTGALAGDDLAQQGGDFFQQSNEGGHG